MSITIVLADDHPVVRRGMQALLEAEKCQRSSENVVF